MEIINSHLWCLSSLPKNTYQKYCIVMLWLSSSTSNHCHSHTQTPLTIAGEKKPFSIWSAACLLRNHFTKLNAFPAIVVFCCGNKGLRSLSIATKVTLQCILNMLHLFGVIIQRVCGIYSKAEGMSSKCQQCNFRNVHYLGCSRNRIGEIFHLHTWWTDLCSSPNRLFFSFT